MSGYGICECGCGEKTSIAPGTDSSKGWVKGRPRRFVLGHYLKMVNPKVEDLFDTEEEGCWNWKGNIGSKGYGRFSRREAHRIVYELLVGEIPEGMQIDHLCRNPRCVNPSHLEVVTPAENTRRGRTAKLTKDNVIFIRSTSMGSRELAEMFGVNQNHINCVRAGHVWKDVAA